MRYIKGKKQYLEKKEYLNEDENLGGFLCILYIFSLISMPKYMCGTNQVELHESKELKGTNILKTWDFVPLRALTTKNQGTLFPPTP